MSTITTTTPWTYTPDATLRSYGRTYLGGSPLRMMRVSATGQAVIERALRTTHAASEPVPLAEQQLIDRFVHAGMMHPEPRVATPPLPYTVVIPIRGRSNELQRLLGALDVPSDDTADRNLITEIIIVDDGTADAELIPDVVATHRQAIRHDNHAETPIRVIRHHHSTGPGQARMTGAEHATTELIAFVDSDCVVTPASLRSLSQYFEEPRVYVVGPRVHTSPLQHSVHDQRWRRSVRAGSRRMLTQYESRHSPLDFGQRGARVSSGTRVSYLPAAMLMVRRSVFFDVGGFDPALRVGEDVDLIWRMVQRGEADHGDGASGWAVRYVAGVRVHHDARTTWTDWVKQRYSYGTSAALLDARHPHRVAPAVIGESSVVVIVALMLSRLTKNIPVVSQLFGIGAAVRVGQHCWQLHQQFNAQAVTDHDVAVPMREAARLVSAGHVGVVTQLLDATVRVWWPVALPIALGSAAGRKLLVAALLRRWWKHANHNGTVLSTSDGVIGIADDMAYGAGVWAGCMQQRSFRALLPRLTRSSKQRSRRHQ